MRKKSGFCNEMMSSVQGNHRKHPRAILLVLREDKTFDIVDLLRCGVPRSPQVWQVWRMGMEMKTNILWRHERIVTQPMVKQTPTFSDATDTFSSKLVNPSGFFNSASVPTGCVSVKYLKWTTGFQSS
jgi:hypothetical protein